MAEKTKIAWCDHTGNAWIGCTEAGPGCDNCYARLLDRNRFSKTLKPAVIHWGVGAPRHQRLDAWERDVRSWNRKAATAGVRRRVFVNSLSDFFDNEVPQAWRERAFGVMRECAALDFLLVTKRIGNAPRMLPADWGVGYANVWLLITVVNQLEADRDIPKLLRIGAVVRGLSIEPQLGPIDLDLRRIVERHHAPELRWVICGGESGSSARIFRPAWARYLRDQCAVAGVPFFMKQMGGFVVERNDHGFDGSFHDHDHHEWPSDTSVEHDIHGYREEFQGADCRVRLVERAGADMDEWPEDLRVRQFPTPRAITHERTAA